MNQEKLFKEWIAAERADGLDTRMHEPADIVPHLQRWISKPQEHFILITLTGGHEIIRVRVISKGILDRTLVHPREVFRPAILDRAAGIICAHNHPSGTTDPSPEDRELTARMCESGKLIGIPVLDHVIVSKRGFYSFLSAGGIS